MPDAPPVKATSSAVSRLLRRLLPLVVVALLFTLLLPRIVRGSLAGEGKPGFGRGVVQGALMPLALPQLLLGKDVSIYAVENTGRTYKLGYTVGVNGCGAIFFGVMFWRLRRWRRKAAQPVAAGPASPEIIGR